MTEEGTRSGVVEVECSETRAEDPVEGLASVGLDVALDSPTYPAELVVGHRACTRQEVAGHTLTRCAVVEDTNVDVTTAAGRFRTVQVRRTDRLDDATEAPVGRRVYIAPSVGVVRSVVEDASRMELELVEFADG